MTFSQRYELLERIGRGGMAEVYRARMHGPDGFQKIVCIKRILAEQSRSPGFEDMFRDEARIAALLCHASIVQVFDFDRDDTGRLFIAMEYVHGVSLRRLQVGLGEKGKELSPEVVAAVARGALGGLHHASTHLHEGRPLNVIHRDISPHNILLSTSGEVKIADFGIAKAFISGVHTRAGVIKGKAAYMSPEQATGKRLDARSDLYSLGVVLWELLAGRRLFVVDGRIPWAALLASRREVPSLETERPGLPSVLTSLVDAMLHPDPDQRPATPADALEHLEGGDLRMTSTIALGELVKQVLPPPRTDPPGPALAPTEPQAREPVTVNVSPITATTSPDTPPDPLDSGDILTSTHQDHPPDKESPSIPEPRTSDHDHREPAHQDIGQPASPRAEKLPVQRRHLLVTSVAVAVGALLAVVLVLGGFRITQELASGRKGTAVTTEAAASGTGHPPVQAGPPAGKTTGLQPPVVDEPSAPTHLRTQQGPDPMESLDESQPLDQEPEAKTGKPVGWGTVNVNAKPWARVFLDGKQVGETPLRLEKIRAGKHVIRLLNPDLDAEKKIRIKLIAGKTALVSHDFTQ